ncbi:hypothetical protein LWC34_09645 [Kibdelosporangium philippinense]|uniref:Uncharacterized protein n=1 Tax=Kibdelosporangium philippinense TaxID=211113 RepID=A0ABS8Z5C2_9PSEU|nr:hypothetical protein [Kibdelosporangium philippinense]MCE7003089.1 hypothetical protein [Kibdelosporangium philippinense]
MDGRAASPTAVDHALVHRLERTFIVPHRDALMRMAQDCQQRAARVLKSGFGRYSAFVEFGHAGTPDRIDVYYTAEAGVLATIGPVDRIGPPLKISFGFGHAVIHSGELTEWWLLHRSGHFRVSPMEPRDMVAILSSPQTATPRIPFRRSKRFFGFTAGEALAAIGEVPLVRSLGHALSDDVPPDNEELRQIVSRHIAVLMTCAERKQREFDGTAKTMGRELPQESLQSCHLSPGYFVIAQFTRTPGKFALYYSGNDGAPAGLCQGAVEFANHQLTSWWFVTPKRRIKIV